MRRSKRVATLLVGTATLLVLSACDEEKPPQDLFYGDLAACKVENTPEECDKAFAEAKEYHALRTEKYKSQSECEDLFGQGRCEQVNVTAQPGTTTQAAGSGSYFVPALMGFMLGRTLGGGYSAGYPLYSDRQGYVYAGGTRMGTCYPPEQCPRPMTTSNSSSSSSRTSSFSSGSSSGRYSVSPSGSSSSASSTGAVSRGGFGSTASSSGSSSSS